MANYTQLITAFNTSVNQRITSKNTTDSIDPVDVGGSITDFANILLPILNTINNFDILKGNGQPTNGQGTDGDIYIQDGSTLAFWKKVNGAWVNKATIDLGINFPDGNVSLQARIREQVVTVSSGTWFIDNVQYAKSVQTQFTVPVADANFDRIDAIFANKSNNVNYVSGTASANPDLTQPVTPADQILVSYIYVPKSSSNQLPYIADSNFQDSGFPTVTSTDAVPTGGIDGDLHFQIPSDNSFLKLWQRISGTWQAVFDLPLTASTPTTDLLRRVFLIPSSDITDSSVNITGRTNEQGDTVIPSDAVVSIYEAGKIVPATYYETGLIEGLDGSLDVKVVLVGGEQVVPAGLILVNTTDVNLNYSVNGGSFSTLNVLDSINVMQGDNLILALSSASAFYQLWNQNGAIENTDSAYLIEEIPHEWQIPLDSTELNIIGVE